MKIRVLSSILVLSLLIISCNAVTRIFSTPSPIPPTPPTLTIPPAATTSPNQGSDNLGDPLYPKLGNGGYDAIHYTIDLNVDVKKNFVNGTSTMDAQATQTLSSFNLDFHGLDISNVTVNASPADFKRAVDELTITPA